MGGGLSIFAKTDFEILVKTGDVKGGGTDSNVYCALIDESGKTSRGCHLDCRWKNDFEKGNTDIFKISNLTDLGKISEIELWRDSRGFSSDWFVEVVMVKQYTIADKADRVTNPEWIPFPCNRWIPAAKKYRILKYDSCLPQFDPRKLQRKHELEEKKEGYEFNQSNKEIPKSVLNVPKEQNFSNDYQWDIATRKLQYLAERKVMQFLPSSKWDDLDDLASVYKLGFDMPYGYHNWKSDESFGAQRLRGCNSNTVLLCTEIPENFAVTADMVEPFLDGISLETALSSKQIYLIDLKVLENVKCKDNRVICPALALFHAKKDGRLMPIAIQLFQEPKVDNPVFLPNDPEYTWMLAKMYFNNADCMLHQSCTHLGFTHLVCEIVCVAANRTLSPSHPVYQLLAPHFLYLIAINSLAVQKLIAPDGWIDQTMTMGVSGLMEILKKTWNDWRLDEHGWLPEELKKRGVDDQNLLPGYVYREDALKLHEAILNYVTEVLTNVYDTSDKLLNDYEVQAFAADLVDNETGGGLKGVFGDGKFLVVDDLIKTCVATIFIGSVQHAAANFCQYDEYAFPPNYPAILSGDIPKDKKPRSEKDIIASLPDRDTTLSIMVVTKLLSERATRPLGDFEVQYQYEPKALAAVEKFRAALATISNDIKRRNEDLKKELKEPYPYLDPEEIPNAISI